jgi:hypothetical protein
MRKEVPAVIQLMNQYSDQASPKEKKLIEVMSLRYSSDTSDKERKSLNIAYARGMRGLISSFPNDPDIKILYVDAKMLIHAWDLWNNDGTPKKWTPDLHYTGYSPGRRIVLFGAERLADSCQAVLRRFLYKNGKTCYGGKSIS